MNTPMTDDEEIVTPEADEPTEGAEGAEEIGEGMPEAGVPAEGMTADEETGDAGDQE